MAQMNKLCGGERMNTRAEKSACLDIDKRVERNFRTEEPRFTVAWESEDRNASGEEGRSPSNSSDHREG